MTFKNKRIKIDMPHDFFFDNTVKKLSGDSILFKKETNDYELKPYLQKITKTYLIKKSANYEIIRIIIMKIK
jgi:hypothetical protein